MAGTSTSFQVVSLSTGSGLASKWILSWIIQNTIQSVTTQETVLLWTGLRFGAVKFSKSDCERGKDSKGAQGTDSSTSENLTNEMRKWRDAALACMQCCDWYNFEY